MDTSPHLQSLFSSCGHFFFLWTLLVPVLFTDTSPPHLQCLWSVLWKLLLSVNTFSSSSPYAHFSSSSVFVLVLWTLLLTTGLDISASVCEYVVSSLVLCIWTLRGLSEIQAIRSSGIPRYGRPLLSPPGLNSPIGEVGRCWMPVGYVSTCKAAERNQSNAHGELGISSW